ncbi:MAG: hemolysin family protein [Chloroflexi bacterium]|nr:hemolysin family protein [Chloroflexota bacterium]MCI0579526.1 hemolysin family protein [Chloroflexota bacterium]MCI0644434.1 hemolysin family protein [Chloroflexota bacterium]MCI0725401.1 hemolysin family protein [Chloroflexota bacterium]
MSTLIAIVALTAVMIFFTGLYVAAEFATVAARRTRISHLAATGNPLAKALAPFMEDPRALDRYVAACQLGITVSSLVLGAYGQNVIAGQLAGPITRLLLLLRPWLDISSEQAAAAIAVSISVTAVLILLTVLQVVFGELFPKSVAIQYPERVAMFTVLPMKWSLAIFRPFIWFFNGSGELILRLLGVDLKRGHGRGVHSPEEIEILVTESHEGGLLNDEKRQMLRNAFRLRDLTARQVMVHRTRIIAAPAGSTVLELMNKVLDAGHTRIPLYQDDIDHIIGFVHVKDVFRLYIQGKENLAEILREVLYVPETLPVVDVWATLENKRQYMAIVFDEFGGTAGLITFEDLIEEIFGELQDEFDEETALISLDAEGRIYLRGDLLVTDVNEYLGLELPDEEADTLGGLVLNALGRPPEVGDEMTIGNTAIRVEAMADLGVTEISLQKVPAEVSAQVGEWEVARHE